MGNCLLSLVLLFFSGGLFTQQVATTAIRKASNNAAIWELTAANALGQITTYRHGGKFNVELGYDTYFNPTTKKLDGTSFAEQSVNSQTGNLSSRKVGTSSESFGYDSQNRLTSWQGGSATYADNGNFQTKTGVGTYTYDPVRQHAVTSVTSVPGNNQTIAYNEAGRATSIEEGAYRLELEYGVDDQRVKTYLYENGTLIKEKRFASGYEKVITGQTVKEISYISAPSGLTAIVVRQAGVDSLFYVYTDHQGSILQLADETGKVVEQRVYDPWGRERDPKNWNNYLTDLGYRRTDRGYTGHEHLPQFGLINMNARLYDPVLGRFLSPDPFVQAPDLSQNFNRYSYCLNNPLLYTDPTGEYFGIDDLIAAILGGAINLVINIVQGNVHSFGQGLAYFGVGAASGVLTIYVGPWAGGALMGAGNSFVTQGFGSSGNWNWGNISGQQVLLDGIMGGLTGQIGSELGGAISTQVSKLTSGIGGQAVKQAITQGITGSAVGFTMNTGFALMNGENIGDALKAGGQGALTGLAIGTVSGMAKGISDAHKEGKNPWTGNDKAAQQIKLKSVGAQGTSIKKIDSNYLKQKGLDAEAIKYEYLGDKAPIARFNLYQTSSGQIIISDGGKVQIPTDYFIK